MKILTGKVISTRMAKTVVVEVNRMVKHPRYKKLLKRDVKFKAHCEKDVKMGDVVQIKECKKRSKDKYFEIVK